MNELASVIKEILEGYKTDPDRDIFSPYFKFGPEHDGLVVGVRNPISGFNVIRVLKWGHLNDRGLISFNYEQIKQSLLSENFRTTGRFSPSQFKTLDQITEATKAVSGFAHVHLESTFIRIDWSSAKRKITSSYIIRTKGRKFSDFRHDLANFINFVKADPSYMTCVHCGAKVGGNDLECNDCYDTGDK